MRRLPDKAVVLHVVDTASPTPQREYRGAYEVVRIRDLRAAERFLERDFADLLVVEAGPHEHVHSITAVRRRFSTIPVVLIPSLRVHTPLSIDRHRRARSDMPVAVAEAVTDLFDGVSSAWSEPSNPAGSLMGTLLPPGRRLSEGIARTLSFLHENFWRDDISLSVVARCAFMSRFHFSRTFRRETGIRYIDYLTRVRLAMGEKFLLETNRSVTEICFDVGYNDLTHFERMFKKQFGLTPSEFRQRNREVRGTPPRETPARPRSPVLSGSAVGA